MGIFRLLCRLLLDYLRIRQMSKAASRGQGAAYAEAGMMKAYMKGDYWTAAMYTIDPFFRGTMLMQNGQLEQAEQLLQKAVNSQTEPRLAAVANSELGRALLEQQQYDRALQCLHTARILWQERGSTDRMIAEIWLRRGGNSAEALRSARSAVEKERASEGLSPDCKNTNLCEELATLAWAVAVESRDAEEVGRLLPEAAALGGANPVTSTAQMHLHFGHAYAALGDVAKSSHHYEQAARVDPNGLMGRAALAMAVGARA